MADYMTPNQQHSYLLLVAKMRSTQDEYFSISQQASKARKEYDDAHKANLREDMQQALSKKMLELTEQKNNLLKQSKVLEQKVDKNTQYFLGTNNNNIANILKQSNYGK